jgi:hypothetical protein
MITIHVKPTLEGGRFVKFNGDDPHVFAECVARLKAFPAYARRYDPQLKSWHVSADCTPELEDFLASAVIDFNAQVKRAAGVGGTGWRSKGGRDEQPQPRRAAQPDPYVVLHLLPSAPLPVVKAAHRALALLHHPDRGGEVAAMQKINLAYEQIASRLVARSNRNLIFCTSTRWRDSPRRHSCLCASGARSPA